MCETQYLYQYVFGLKSRPNFKTERGSIIHKALELLAHKKVAEQDGKSGFYEEELGKEFWIEDISLESAVNYAWDHYTYKNECQYKWTNTEYEECHKWTRDVVEFGNGMFSPLNRKVIKPEQYFDLEIKSPETYYSYIDVTTGKKIEGYLAIKGTIDLLTEVNAHTIEYLDWKSGRPRWNWETNKEKSYQDLQNDPQLLIYFYSLSRLYPEYRTKAVTIYYAQENKPYTISFTDNDINRALDMIKKRFLLIKNTIKPTRIMDDKSKKWKCNFCSFSKEKFEGSNISQCNQMYGDLIKLGMEKTTKKYGKPGVIGSYSGGGQTDRITIKQ